MRSCRENPDVAKIGQACRTFGMKTYVSAVVAREKKSPLKCPFNKNDKKVKVNFTL
jgi:hypothetical protein